MQPAMLAARRGIRPFSAAGGELAGVQSGDGGFPVDTGEQGGAVADAGAGLLVKSSRCSQLPHSMSRPVPARRAPDRRQLNASAGR
jgi:hypothetical protein